MSGNSAGPCPKCGGTGDVPDGIYTAFDDVVSFLAASDEAEAKMQSVIDVLRAARDGRSTPEAAVNEMRAAIPDAPQTFWNTVDSVKGRGLYALLMLALTVFAAAQPYLKSDQPGIAPRDVEAIVERAVTAASERHVQRTGPVQRGAGERPGASGKPPENDKVHKAQKKKKRREARHARRRNRR